MNHLQTYKIFEAKKGIELNTKQIAFLRKYVNNISPGRWGWDVSYSTDPPIVNIFTTLNTGQFSKNLNKKIKSLQGIHFGKIKGDFILRDIIISTYEGFPKEVGGDFAIGLGADLKVPLADFPEIKIDGCLTLCINDLKSLEGCPKEVGSFHVADTGILDMIGCPKIYNNPSSGMREKKIYLSRNYKLISLEGIPNDVRIDEIGINEGLFKRAIIYAKDLIEGLENFRKIGSWVPYFLKIREKYPIILDEKINEYIDSKITPESIQEFINLDPAVAVVSLKGVWPKMKNDPKFSEIKFPGNYSKELNLLSDLDDIGL